jgi:anti-repressor protein
MKAEMNSQGSTAIQAFVFPRTKHKVRVVIDKHGNPWWVAKDVCDVLGIGNVSDALSRLDDDEKNTIVLNDGNRGNPNMTVVNESGLYALIMTSRKPEAKAFKKWVTSEVLPSIRKTGSYGHKPQQQLDPSDPAQLLKCLVDYTQRTLELQEEKAKLETKLEARPPRSTLTSVWKPLRARSASRMPLNMSPTELTD